MRDKDSHLIWEAYEGDDPYADWEHLSVAVMETLGDYGMYEANLRPSSTVDKGVEEIKDLVKGHLAATGKDHNEVYNELDQMNMEGEQEMAGEYEDDDEEMMINMRLRDMLKAARADVTWEEWTDMYAGEPAKGNVEDALYQSYADMAKHYKETGELPESPKPEEDGDEDWKERDDDDWWRK
jgi:hypothetical protein